MKNFCIQFAITKTNLTESDIVPGKWYFSIWRSQNKFFHYFKCAKVEEGRIFTTDGVGSKLSKSGVPISDACQITPFICYANESTPTNSDTPFPDGTLVYDEVQKRVLNVTGSGPHQMSDGSKMYYTFFDGTICLIERAKKVLGPVADSCRQLINPSDYLPAKLIEQADIAATYSELPDKRMPCVVQLGIFDEWLRFFNSDRAKKLKPTDFEYLIKCPCCGRF